MVKNKKKVSVVIKQQPNKQQKRKKKEKELTRLGAALRGLGGLGGSALGGLIGMPSAGSAAGSSIGAAISKWLGSGDYQISSNTLLNGKGSPSIPMMHDQGQSIVIRHKEFIGEIKSSIAFTVQKSMPLNPGLPSSFPWLARLATCYQQYEVRGMVYHYIPTSGSAIASTNNALGSVMLQTTYRASESTPYSKTELLNEYWSNETVPSETVCHPIECAPKENPFQVHYIRTGNLPSTENLLMYDVGKTYVCTSGQQADGTVLGDLWVTYEIVLRKPIVQSDVSSGTYFSAIYTDTNTLGFSASSIFGIVSKIPPQGNLPITVVNNTITLDAQFTGDLLIMVRLVPSGSVTGFSLGGAPTLTSCRLVNLNNYTDRFEAVSTGTLTSTSGLLYVVRIQKTDSSSTATIQIPTPTGTFTLSSSIVEIIGSPNIPAY